ncbi:MAG: hypothetical protein WAM72_18050 [Xanthobacteraceae bacterium]
MQRPPMSSSLKNAMMQKSEFNEPTELNATAMPDPAVLPRAGGYLQQLLCVN